MKKVMKNKMFLIFALLVVATLLFLNRHGSNSADLKNLPNDDHSINYSESNDLEPLEFNSDEVSFGDAFSAARSQLGEDQEFYYNGSKYSTNLKDWSKN